MIRQLLLIGALQFTLACASNPCRCSEPVATTDPLVLMTDFTLKDGAVSAMKGVAYQVNPHLVVSDLTHEVPAFNIWEGAYRLNQTYKYWPKGTVFVTVVDPGVGSERHSVVVHSKSGHYFVGPDNGLYTLLADEGGIESVRVIDENKQRLKGSDESNTFHGRDLYVYVGARLASGQLTFADAGQISTAPLVKIPYQRASATNGVVSGVIPILDTGFGNVWSEIPKALVLGEFPGAKTLQVTVSHGSKKVFAARLPLATTFAAVPRGQPLLYFNSLLNLSLALNQGDFAKHYGIQSGPDWTMTLQK